MMWPVVKGPLYPLPLTPSSLEPLFIKLLKELAVKSDFKVGLPKFKREHGADVFIDWVKKADQIFHCKHTRLDRKVDATFNRLTCYTHIRWSDYASSRRLIELPPVCVCKEMKALMHPDFVPDDQDLELYREFHAWKMTATMTVREYTKGLQTMSIKLHSSEGEAKLFNKYTTGQAQDIQDEFYQFRITTINEAIAKAQKAELKLKKALSSTTKVSTETTNAPCTNTALGLLVRSYCKEPGQS